LIQAAAEKDVEVFVATGVGMMVRAIESTVLKRARSPSPSVLAETETRESGRTLGDDGLGEGDAPLCWKAI
jgi:hypothetical protein